MERNQSLRLLSWARSELLFMNSSLYHFHGAGIGSGYGFVDSGCSVEIISIVDGIFRAASLIRGAAAGTYMTPVTVGISFVGTISVYNGTINAVGSSGAGIESGWGYRGNSSLGTIAIYKGAFPATGSHAAGIGPGCGEDGNSLIGDLFIRDGGMTAEGSVGAGIRSGYVLSDGSSTVETVSISVRWNTAAGTNRAGIAAGYRPLTRVYNVTITGGTFTIFSRTGAAVGASTNAAV
jgi:hypothetical protein